MAILVIDDHAVVRTGIRNILTSRLHVDVAEAASANEALEYLERLEPRAIVLDLRLPDVHGLELLKRIGERWPAIPVLILSIHAEKEYAVRALRAGAAGYVRKDAPSEELVAAVQKILAGGKYVSDALAQHLATELATPADVPHARLTDRELQVLESLAAGRSLTTIARELGLSVKTVSTYRTRLLEKLNLRTNADLVRYAIEHGLER